MNEDVEDTPHPVPAEAREVPERASVLHDNGDGTWSFWCDLLDGEGRESITVKLPSRLRCTAINNAIAENSEARDMYAWGAISAAAVYLGYVPGRQVEIDGPPAVSIIELGDRAADALYNAGFDVFSEAYLLGTADLLAEIVKSVSARNKRIEAAKAEAEAVFPEAEEGPAQ